MCQRAPRPSTLRALSSEITPYATMGKAAPDARRGSMRESFEELCARGCYVAFAWRLQSRALAAGPTDRSVQTDRHRRPRRRAAPATRTPRPPLNSPSQPPPSQTCAWDDDIHVDKDHDSYFGSFHPRAVTVQMVCLVRTQPSMTRQIRLPAPRTFTGSRP
jgi:hypothetical protein